MMLSAYLEQSLQLVDPSTALHYMEYTKYFSESFDSRKRPLSHSLSLSSHQHLIITSITSTNLNFDPTLDVVYPDLENQFDGGLWTVMMSDKYFGSSDPITGRILDGRWKDQKVPFVDEAFFAQHGIDPTTTFFPEEEEAWLQLTSPHLTSPYGLLRSPWYYNPSPYLARFNAINLPSLSEVPFESLQRCCVSRPFYFFPGPSNWSISVELFTSG
jgi:hypothetical protein